MPEATPPRRVNPVIQGLVMVYMAMVVIWTLPEPPSDLFGPNPRPSTPQNLWRVADHFLAVNDLASELPVVENALMVTGLWQNWGMFSPNPAKTDLWMDAEVTFLDGTKAVVPYPRIKTMNLVDKFLYERYRKYYENTNDDIKRHKWPALAQRMALLGTTDPANPAVEVRLRRHFRTILPPGQPTPDEYTMVEFFATRVDREKLLRDLRR